MKTSKRSEAVGPASSIELNELVYAMKDNGREPIVLSYGEAPFKFDALSFNGIDFNEGAHYSESMGVKSFRKRLAEYHLLKHASVLQIDQIMVTVGSKIASYLALLAILNNGDEVLLHEPSWVSYQEHAKLCGASVRFISFQERAQEFSTHFRAETKVLILNNPNNPRGYLYSKEEILLCAKQCLLSGIYLIIDESYSDFIEDGSFYSATNLVNEYENVIVLNSISKNLGLSGWRIGYLIANTNFINNVLKLNQHLITCAPTILQNYLAVNFFKILAEIKLQMAELMAKRKRVQVILKKLGIEFLDGVGTFYFFLNLEKYHINAKDLSIELLKSKEVAVIPGNAYGENLKDFVRISIGVESEERIEEGLNKLLDFLKK